METSIETIRPTLRKYARGSVIDKSLDLMRKLGKVEGDGLSHRETAELIYLSCGVSDKERTRAAVTMLRDNTTAGRAVLEIMRLLTAPDGNNESGIPSSVLRDISRYFRGVSAPGYYNNQRIQVRGGSNHDWTAHAAGYVLTERSA